MLWLIETARGSNPASLTVDKYKKQGTSNISLNTNFHLFNSPPEKFKKRLLTANLASIPINVL